MTEQQTLAILFTAIAFFGAWVLVTTFGERWYVDKEGNILTAKELEQKTLQEQEDIHS